MSEQERTNLLIAAFKYMKHSNAFTVAVLVSSLALQLCIVLILRHINNNPGEVSEFWNWVYLTNQRVLFTLAAGMIIMTFIMKSPAVWPITAFLSHSFWIPFARLSYGAYLTHSIFMLFREFNAERGTWASQFEAVLLFCAYLTFAFLFSLIITLTIETPCHRLYKEFIKNEKAFEPELKGSTASMVEDDYSLG